VGSKATWSSSTSGVVMTLIGVPLIIIGYAIVGGREGVVIALIGWILLLGGRWFERHLLVTVRRWMRRRVSGTSAVKSRLPAVQHEKWWRDASRLDPWTDRAISMRGERNWLKVLTGDAVLGFGLFVAATGIALALYETGPLGIVVGALLVIGVLVGTVSRLGLVASEAGALLMLGSSFILVWAH
jgi:hypothetical protein